MIKYILDKKNNKASKILYNNLMNILSENFHFINTHSDWVLDSIFFSECNNITCQQVFKGSVNNQDINPVMYKISGVEIFSKIENSFVPVSIFSYGEVIQYIELGFHSNITKEFDINNLTTSKLEVNEIVTENPELKTVTKILSNLSSNQIESLDLQNTIEIEFEAKLLFTIVDMEDGNYIAIDKKQSVYRLIHDHQQPIKKICENMNDFLKLFEGNKKRIGHLFH